MSPTAFSAHPGRAQALVLFTVLLAMSITVMAPATTSAAPTDDATPGVSPDRMPRNERRAIKLVERVATVDQTVSYSGVQFVSAWSPTGTASTVLDVHNVAGQGTALRVRGSGAGPAAAMFTGGPENGVDGWLGGGPVELLHDNYGLRYAGRTHAAGRSAEIVEMFGAADLLAARFWIDRETGLLLRRELYDSSGRTVRASAFIEVRTGPRAVPSHLPPMTPLTPTQTVSRTEMVDLQRAGWACPQQMAGHLTLYDTRRVQTTNGVALHFSYSDGLSTVSVFQQAGSIGANGLTGYERVEGADGIRYLRAGIPEQIVWSADGVVYAVMADAPPELVEQVVADLPHAEPSGNGVLDRVGRGLNRVGSWVNPFA